MGADWYLIDIDNNDTGTRITPMLWRTFDS